ncbi:MAG: ribosome-binding factor A [Myxococcales bacterium]|nr:ribosome-binding factor A [Myxococcales bacterium]
MTTPTTRKIDPHRRAGRVAARIQQELSAILLRDFDDPRLRELVISSVEVTDDLSLARVRYVIMGEDADGRRALTAGKRLGSLAPSLRVKLAPRLEMRRVPVLSIEHDAHLHAGDGLDKLLAEVATELKKP